MKRGSNEFVELQKQFEKDVNTMPVYISGNMERSSDKNSFYDNGNIDNLFHAYMAGYQFAKSLNRLGCLEVEE